MNTRMIKNVVISIFVTVCFNSMLLKSAQAEEEIYIPRAVCASFVDKAPIINGIINDIAWTGVNEYGDFVDSRNGNASVVKTKFKLLYDKDALYIGIWAEEPFTNNILAYHNERDSDVWRDDCIEIFLQPNKQENGYYHLAFNTKGAQYDSRDQDPTIDVKWDCTVSLQKNGWTAEVKIPFKSIDVNTPFNGESWGFNICRVRKEDTSVGKLKQNSCWSRRTQGFHEIEGFGELIFGNFSSAFHRKCAELLQHSKIVKELFPSTSGEIEREISRLQQINNQLGREKDYHKALLELFEVRHNLSNMNLSGLDTKEVDPQIANRGFAISHLGPYESLPKKDEIFAIKACTKKDGAITLKFEQAINEFETNAFVISALRKIPDLYIRLSDLKSDNGDKIEAKNIKCYNIGYLEPDPRVFCYRKWNEIPIPDLVEEIRGQLVLDKFQNLHVWVIVNSIDAKPGRYQGTVYLENSDSRVVGQVNCEVEIWPFALPLQPDIDLSIYSTIPWGGKSGELWAILFKEHYVTYVDMEQPPIYAGEEFVKPTGRGEKDIELKQDIKGKRITIPGNKYDHLERLKIIRKYGMKLNLYSNRGIIQTALLPAYIEYLKSAGFSYDDFRYKISDENTSPETLRIYQEFINVDPYLRTVFCPAGDWDISCYRDYVDTYMCSRSVGAWERWLPFFNLEQAYGKKFIVYTNWPSWAGRTVPLRGRCDFDVVWNLKANEYLVWTMEVYPPRNYQYPYGRHSSVDIRTLAPEQQTLATLVYFRRDGDIFRPVSCKRLESIRDGVKDWMYFQILDNLINDAKRKNLNAAAERYQKKMQRSMLMNERTKQAFDHRKKLLAQNIMELDKIIQSSIPKNK